MVPQISLSHPPGMSLFELIGAVTAVIALFGYINHRFIRLPDTIGITATGLLVSLGLALMARKVPGLVAWANALADRIDFSDIVLHGLLGVLLFAGSLHVNLADLARYRVGIVVLSTVGVAISTLVVGVGMQVVLAVLGHSVPLVHCLMFGALISPTDPIAVLGVLKRSKVPHALEMKITGESLFNDGTAVVAFLLMLGLSQSEASFTWTWLGNLLLNELLGAVVLGLLAGYGAFFMLKGVESYPVEILITLALPLGGYALAERLHVSAPLAVVIMGLVIGNHGAKHAMSEHTREHLFSFYDLLDEVLNLVLFGLIGIKLITLADDDVYWFAALAIVPVVLFARWASVGLPLVLARRWLSLTPHSVTVLTWGGLRGGISIALALSLPAMEARPLFVASAYAVVLFSLLVQAPSLGLLLRKLQLGGESPKESARTQ